MNFCFSNRKMSFHIKYKVFGHYFLTAISILQHTEEISDCDIVGHIVILYTEKMFCNLFPVFFLKHLSSLNAKSNISLLLLLCSGSLRICNL